MNVRFLNHYGITETYFFKTSSYNDPNQPPIMELNYSMTLFSTHVFSNNETVILTGPYI